MGEGGLIDAAREHPGQLFEALLVLHPPDAGYGAAPRLLFGDDDVGESLGGNLGQVRDGEDNTAEAPA